ncbi:vesicle coat complex subunit [Encephalitozoon romaleae SJ-2008]|uniref:Vesicle coat complex subunit n=1 Tax=Encephalitozoon romaleae (strain SJ-2008) TaxID=1178016 RepID=I6ZIZ2_ENCRO|nr:vesicle coat complex subunit [Encephalitozoon romaleae SJ-2008]AFN83163.1 vesicle coat complex subunit [Encephalitozoon romaleae SJ-2008]
MGIKDAFGMSEIRKLFGDDAFVASPLSKSQIVKYISSPSPKKQMQAAKSLMCRMQCGEDLSDLCNDVIKAIDTRDAEFKRMLNLYLVRYIQGWPAKQLICINTMLKDLGDGNKEMRYCAIQDSGLLGDGVVIKNYINPLKEHGKSQVPETRRKVADSLQNYFRKDSKLFYDSGLCDLLKDLAFDEDPSVSASALNSIQVIEEETKILSTEDIYKLFRRNTESGSKEVLGSLLEVMRNRVEDFHDPSLLVGLLATSNLRVFYLASSLLISIDPSYKQMVFDHLKGFLSSYDEELYLVLDYAESLLKDVSYDNSCFAIYHSDKKYNKIKKLRLLFKRLDATSIKEIKNQCRDEELLSVILRESLDADYLIEEPLKCIHRSDEMIRVLYEADTIPEKWEGVVRELLMNARKVEERQKYIYLCGRYVHEVPLEIMNIQNLGIPSLTNETIRFYLNLHRRGVASLEETLAYLRLIQKGSKDRVKMVINELKVRGIGVFATFCDSKKRDFDGADAKRFVTVKPKEKSSSILDVKPYYGLEENRLIGDDSEKITEEFPGGEESLAESCFSLEKGSGNADGRSDVTGDSAALPSSYSHHPTLFLGKQDEENVWLRFAERQYSIGGKRGKEEESMRLIDTNGLKGILSISNDEVILQVDILESPLVIYYKCKGRLNNVRVDAEGVFPLFSINLSVVNSKFSLTIGKSTYGIHLGIRSLMVPYKCSKGEFEKGFQELKDYILLDGLDMERTYPVDSYSFSFSVLGSRFYGKHLDNQVILKGSKKLLGLF